MPAAKEVGGFKPGVAETRARPRAMDALALARNYDLGMVMGEAHARARQGRSSVVITEQPYGRAGHGQDLTPHYLCLQSYVWHLCGEVSACATPLLTIEALGSNEIPWARSSLNTKGVREVDDDLPF